MELFENSDDFYDLITTAADYYHISPSIIEKDYYVTFILKQLKEYIPGLLFKGGTSLNKCYKIINRFSEDIDLTLDVSHFTQSYKRKANKSVIAICDKFNFKIQNREAIEYHSHGNYNCYNIEYPSIFSNEKLKPYIKLEMTFIQKAYPDTMKPLISIIGEYLTTIDQNKILMDYGLEPFKIKVQSLERTFVDKVFAICDYYMRGEYLRHSRHLYDLHKLMEVINWNDLNKLINDVREERKPNKTCVSAQDSVSIPEVLTNIIKTEYFKKDYVNVTTSLLNEKLNYDTVILSIKKIAESSLFDT